MHSPTDSLLDVIGHRHPVFELLVELRISFVQQAVRIGDYATLEQAFYFYTTIIPRHAVHIKQFSFVNYKTPGVWLAYDAKLNAKVASTMISINPSYGEDESAHHQIYWPKAPLFREILRSLPDLISITCDLKFALHARSRSAGLIKTLALWNSVPEQPITITEVAFLLRGFTNLHELNLSINLDFDADDEGVGVGLWRLHLFA
ncbi:BQ2448_4529 [Microbotryum intermedium]|uniref:BQ2448_4529 protein n=1 Tax=Microbotryum intermedium TaxID=269621 RepID=A0A238FF58_9BASI|nr:BQ2448_4529 [Microbotryum intermedium]